MALRGLTRLSLSSAHCPVRPEPRKGQPFTASRLTGFEEREDVLNAGSWRVLVAPAALSSVIRYRARAARHAVPGRPITALAEDQEPGGAGRATARRRRLELNGDTAPSGDRHHIFQEQRVPLALPAGPVLVAVPIPRHPALLGRRSVQS